MAAKCMAVSTMLATGFWADDLGSESSVILEFGDYVGV